MQFSKITIFAIFFSAVAAVPTGSEFEAIEAREVSEARELGISVAKRSACTIACDVLCNSTVLALAQTKCLEVCKGKC